MLEILMRIYLDLCCFNRPFDDQAQARIRLETEAKIILQQKVKDAECELIWSSILDFECSMNPFEDRRIAILNWRNVACDTIMADEPVLEQAFGLLGTESAPTMRCTQPVQLWARLMSL